MGDNRAPEATVEMEMCKLSLRIFCWGRADIKQCECDFVNEAAEGEDEGALFCEGDVEGIREVKVDGEKVGICGHGRCEDCEILVGG